MQNHQWLTLHWRSFSEWGSERLSTCLLYEGCQYIRKWQCGTIVDILKLTVGYLNTTIRRKTRNAEPEIGTNRSSQTRQNPQVEVYQSGFGSPRRSRTAFCTGLELNWPIFRVRTWTAGTLPGSVANTTNIWQMDVCNSSEHILSKIPS